MTPDQPTDPALGQPAQPHAYPPPGYRPEPQLIVKPGGLSTAMHLVHIAICFFTCGLWIPGYIVMAILFAPNRRVEVIVPMGADQQAVAAAYAKVAELTPAEKSSNQMKYVFLAAAVLLPLVVCTFWIVPALVTRQP